MEEDSDQQNQEQDTEFNLTAKGTRLIWKR